jgi:hypothetical protein
MTGLSNYTADNLLNWLTGGAAEPSLPAVYCALFTVVGTDAGSGFTEVSGGSYARAQVAGTALTNNTTASGNNTLHIASVPAWVVAGMYIYDATAPTVIGAGTYVSSTTTNTVVMSGNASGAGVGNGDTIIFSAFSAATGTAPSSITNNAVITFPQATANWGTVIAWGLYDASSSSNLLLWDFLGAYNWLPVSSSSVGSGNGAVMTTHAHGYSNGDPIVATTEYGGSFPTATQESLTSYVVNYAANVATDTFTLSTSSSAPSSANALWTSTTGDFMVRKIVQQSIPQNVTASFAASALTALAA